MLTTAPDDPREPAAGAGPLPAVTALDELTTRVLAPNPSPMTLDGTNTYVLGVPGSGEVVVVDPGPEDGGHLDRVRSVVRDRDAMVACLLVTHHHADHAAAAGGWARHFGCPVASATRLVDDTLVLADGDRIPLDATSSVEVVATPGHTADHLAFRIPNGALLTGDHVLGRGTSVVAYPDGHLESYLQSLRRVLGLSSDALYPGHGPELTDEVTAVVAYYLAHRLHRLREITSALADGPAGVSDLVQRIYPDVDEARAAAAAASTRAALELLADRGLARVVGLEGRVDEDATYALVEAAAIDEVLRSLA